MGLITAALIANQSPSRAAGPGGKAADLPETGSSDRKGCRRILKADEQNWAVGSVSSQPLPRSRAVLVALIPEMVGQGWGSLWPGLQKQVFLSPDCEPWNAWAAPSFSCLSRTLRVQSSCLPCQIGSRTPKQPHFPR